MKKEKAGISKKDFAEYYGGHHYENIFTRLRSPIGSLKKFGIDKRLITLSALV